MASTQQQLQMSVRRADGTVVLSLSGEADIAEEARLRLRLRDLLSLDGREPVRHLVVDAAGLAFLDLTALQVLLDAAAELRSRGGRLVLRRPTRRVRRLVALLDLADRLTLEE